MQKMVALVVLRIIPHSGTAFRRWFAKRVSDMYWHTLSEQARDFYTGFQPSVAHYCRMRQLDVDISTSVARYNYKQNFRVDARLRRNVWFNYWGWHEKAKSQKRL